MPKNTTDDSRFAFGENWQRFLSRLDEQRIKQSTADLAGLLGVSNLTGKSFLDIGSGSGLSSLAAKRLGAQAIHSLDYDLTSVACTTELKKRFFTEDETWTIEQGDALDEEYMKKQGTFDVVYSWGVLHHTGDMWAGLTNAARNVAKEGLLCVAIYNDQGRTSRLWTKIKRAYNSLPSGLRFLVLWPCLLRLWGPTTIRDMLKGRPGHTWRTYSSNRGMSAWHDVVDWVGGYPFEVAKPCEIFSFYKKMGFTLVQMKTNSGIGCNEFVFKHTE